jgi:hypothetical protein
MSMKLNKRTSLLAVRGIVILVDALSKSQLQF